MNASSSSAGINWFLEPRLGFSVSVCCVFWMKSTDRTFATVAEDHANCSVGSWTHGFKQLEEVADNGDVAALLESGWVTMDMIPMITTVSQKR